MPFLRLSLIETPQKLLDTYGEIGNEYMGTHGEKANEKTHEYEETSTQTEVILQMNRRADGYIRKRMPGSVKRKGDKDNCRTTDEPGDSTRAFLIVFVSPDPQLFYYK